jgi:hypothetical protein
MYRIKERKKNYKIKSMARAYFNLRQLRIFYIRASALG